MNYLKPEQLPSVTAAMVIQNMGCCALFLLVAYGLASSGEYERCIAESNSTEPLCRRFVNWLSSHQLRRDFNYSVQLVAFAESARELEEQLRLNPLAQFELNHFATWPRAVWLKTHGGKKSVEQPARKVTTQSTTTYRFTLGDPPTSIDWRNVTTPVKDQGNCGSCWAHAAVEQVESHVAIQGGELTPLSVQQILSCFTSDPTESKNCNGGVPGSALDYVSGSGLILESDYPYESGDLSGSGCAGGYCDLTTTRCLSVPNWCPAPYSDVAVSNARSDDLPGQFCFDGQCSLDSFGCCLTTADSDLHSETSESYLPGTQAGIIDDNVGRMCLYHNYPLHVQKNSGSYQWITNDEGAFLSYLASSGPLGIHIAGSSIASYKSGIITDCDNIVNHAVQLVGYGVENDVNYWLIRNSWGASWGENGFFRIKRDVNMCGIEAEQGYYFGPPVD